MIIGVLTSTFVNRSSAEKLRPDNAKGLLAKVAPEQIIAHTIVMPFNVKSSTVLVDMLLHIITIGSNWKPLMLASFPVQQ